MVDCQFMLFKKDFAPKERAANACLASLHFVRLGCNLAHFCHKLSIMTSGFVGAYCHLVSQTQDGGVNDSSSDESYLSTGESVSDEESLRGFDKILFKETTIEFDKRTISSGNNPGVGQNARVKTIETCLLSLTKSACFT